jgi:hypothetical protein
VRTPLKGWHGQAWNVVGARTISQTGRQLFLIDRFRDTDKPLLSVLADPESIFMHALSQFRTRTLYANITNDRSAVYYTTSISRTDPFANLNDIKVNYLPGYSPLLVDSSNPVVRLRRPSQPAPLHHTKGGFLGRWVGSAVSLGWADFHNLWLRARLALFFAMILPIGGFLFLLNAALQSIMSVQRLRVHAADGAREAYAVPILQQRLEQARMAAESMFENFNSKHNNEYIEETTSVMEGRQRRSSASASDSDSTPLLRKHSRMKSMSEEFPVLALTEGQFDMIKSLNDVGWRKYPVHINEVRHSHAAIINRMNRDTLSEGKIVIGHWLDHFEQMEKEVD